MWLINVDDFTLREVHEPGGFYRYGILSHTWEEVEGDLLRKEVSFQDMQNITQARQKSGWTKIEKTCELARNYRPRLQWVWIDTCCIDKSSSAELTEAINSMFKWYNDAHVCFVYLTDMPEKPTVGGMDGWELSQHLEKQLSRCRWFTRGWTLQELIAPINVEFHDRSWTKIGTKVSLQRIITEITGIGPMILEHNQPLSSVPVAQRMYWASKRITKRIEDAAYSLFGIFDVNMPLIYGEGQKAFLRLQDAIIQQTDDLTLFAWQPDTESGHDNNPSQQHLGIFAQSPRNFESCRYIVPVHDFRSSAERLIVSTNREMQFQTYLVRDQVAGGYTMDLCCHDQRKTHAISSGQTLNLFLIKTPTGFARCGPIQTRMFTVTTRVGSPYNARIPKQIDYFEDQRLVRRFENAFRFRFNLLSFHNILFAASLASPSFATSSKMLLGGMSAQDHDHAYDEVNKIYMTGNNPDFLGMLSPSTTDDSPVNWPTGFRVLFGFHKQTGTQESREPVLSPWVGFITDREDPDVIVHDGDPGHRPFDTVKLAISLGTPYRSAIWFVGRYPTTLSALVPTIGLRGSRFQAPGFMMMLSLSLNTERVNGLPSHEVTLQCTMLRLTGTVQSMESELAQ